MTPAQKPAVRLASLAIALAVLLGAARALAFSGGIATTSFPLPAQGCNFCHTGGTAPSVTLECVDCGGGPPAVLPLSVHEFRLTVFEVGLQNRAGLNVSSVLGTLATGGSQAAGTQTIPGAGGRLEITHTMPRLAAGGTSEFSFLWTAPASPGTATLAGWGNAVTGDGSTAGDAASSVTLPVDVLGDTPTPTATPTATPLLSSTPTATPTLPGQCPAAADGGCTTGFARGLLLVRDDIAGREKLVAKLVKGPALEQTDLGNPLAAGQGGTGTAYSLCIYDGANDLAGGVLVDRAGDTCDTQPCWQPIGRAPNDPRGPGSGYRYRDRLLAEDGILRLRYKGGAAGTTRAVLVGRGPGLPGGVAAALQSSSQVTVQLRSSDGLCLSLGLSDIRVQQPGFFKAR